MTPSKKTSWEQALIGAAVAASLVAWIYLAQSHSLNQDEGYYARATLHVLDGDTWLHETDLDKPPLLFWLQAPGIALFGQNELGARAMGIVSCLIVLLLTGRIAAKLAKGSALDPEGARTAAIWLTAASPYLLMLGPLGMTDAPAAVFSLLAIDAALDRKPARTGVWVGFAWAVRQLGLLALFLPALLFLFDRIQSGERSKELRSGLRGDLKRFLLGFAVPFVPLLLWTAFVAQDPFLWMVGEIFGKKGMTAPSLEPLIKIKHWINVSMQFTPAAGASMLGLLALLALPLALPARGRRLRFQLLAMAAAALFFYAMFTLWGFPRYPRYLFPILPLAVWGLSATWSMLLSGLGQSSRRAASTALALVCLFALALNTAAFSRPYPRDDLSSLASYIDRNADDRAAIMSRDLNRQLLFYLHGRKFKMGQWHDDAGRISALLERYETRQVWMFLQRDDGELDDLGEFLRFIGPKRELILEAEGPHDQIRLYRVKPLIRPAGNPGALALIDRDEYRRVDAGEISDWVRTGIEAKMHAQGLVVNVRPDMLRSSPETIVLASMEIEADTLELDGLRFTDVTLGYTDAEVYAGSLISFGSVRLTDPGRAQGSMSLLQSELAGNIAGKNPNMSDVRVHIDDGSVGIEAEVDALGLNIGIEVSGSVTIEQGQVFYRLQSARIAGIGVPQRLLKTAESRINPVIKTKLPRLGLQVSDIRARQGSLLFELGSE